MVIMIAGPFRQGSTNKELWATNLAELNRVAYLVFQKGHIPVIGVNLALPVIENAGFEYFDDLMMPISLGIAEKCDAVLRIGGSSTGADEEVKIFERKGLPVFYSLEEVPDLR